MTDELVVVELVEITPAWPTQWEGRLVDDRAIFVHYRNNLLTIWIGERGETGSDLVGQKPWFEQTIESPFAGDISWDRVETITGLRMQSG